MKATIWDTDALHAVSPAALSAYARSLGWIKTEPYGDHSDVYECDAYPEIILPRTQRLGDYANVVSQLISYFSDATDVDALSLYRDLVTADRDVIRVRAPADEDSGSVAMADGIELLGGARDMLLAAACSLSKPKPLYRAGANREASDYLSRVQLGQTEHGSFVITLLSPVISPPLQEALFPDDSLENDPFERQVTRRLSDALSAARGATERTVSGDLKAFSEAVNLGVSANLCEALAQLIEPFPRLDITVSWARTHPRPIFRDVIRFASGDAPILRAAAQSFRAFEPKPDTRVFGSIWKLARTELEQDGTITMHASVEGVVRSVTAILSQSDYHTAVQAHDTKSPLILNGDLEQSGQRWRLLNARIEAVILLDDETEEEG